MNIKIQKQQSFLPEFLEPDIPRAAGSRMSLDGKLLMRRPASQAGGKQATKTHLAKYFWVETHVEETRLHSKFLIFVDIFPFKMLVTFVFP